MEVGRVLEGKAFGWFGEGCWVAIFNWGDFQLGSMRVVGFGSRFSTGLLSEFCPV